MIASSWWDLAAYNSLRQWRSITRLLYSRPRCKNTPIKSSIRSMSAITSSTDSTDSTPARMARSWSKTCHYWDEISTRRSLSTISQTTSSCSRTMEFSSRLGTMIWEIVSLTRSLLYCERSWKSECLTCAVPYEPTEIKSSAKSQTVLLTQASFSTECAGLGTVNKHSGSNW